MRVAAPRVVVERNTIEQTPIGVAVSAGADGEVVQANTVAGGEDGNVLRHNTYDGLQIEFPAPGSSLGGIVRANDVHYNGGDGIAIYGCDVNCDTAPSSFVVDHNATGANGRYDCFDVRAANDIWSANIGVTDSPASLCAAH